MVDMQSSHSPEETYHRNAILLFGNRDGEGRLIKEGLELSATTATQLLGRIDSVSEGQGGFALMIPTRALKEADLETKNWEMAAQKGAVELVNWKGSDHYWIDYNFATHGVLPVLEQWAGKSWNDARTLAQQYAHSNTPNTIG